MELNKIYHMDCLEGMKQIPDNSIDLIITSPPYNVGIDYNVWNDEMDWDEYSKFMQEWLSQAYKVLKSDGRICLNIPYEVNLHERGGRLMVVSEYWQTMKKIGFKFAGIVDLEETSSQRVKCTAWGSWLSPSSPYLYNPKECCIIAYKKQWKKQHKGESDFVDNEVSKKEFMDLVFGKWTYFAETQCPTKANFSLDIPLKALKILSYKNDIILDPFIGSGTTAIACKQLQRNFIGFDIDKEYYDVAIRRIKRQPYRKWW